MAFDMDMSELLGVFLEEAEEQLQRLDDGFLAIEKDPRDAEVLGEVFRAAHTLKGSSATMGFTRVAELTHAMESLLDLLRNGSFEADSATVDLLLQCSGVLRQLVESLSSGSEAEIDTSELLGRLRGACDGAGNCDHKPDTAAPPRDEALETPSPSSEHMTLKIRICDSCTMPSVRAFMVYNALSGQGDVVSSQPPESAIDDTRAGEVITITFAPVGDPQSVVACVKSLAETSLEEVVMPRGDERPAEDRAKAEARKAAEAARDSGVRAIQTVRVGVDRLDMLMNLVAELVIDRTRISRIEANLGVRYENEEMVAHLAETSAHIGRVVTELQEQIMKIRLLPVEQVFSRFPRMVRDVARRAGKEVEFVLEGQETELDRSILEEIVDPITHLLRNSVDHGIEPPEERIAGGKPREGKIVLAAKQEENRIIIEVEDDGKGISVEKVKAAALRCGTVDEQGLSRLSDTDALQLIFAAGLSTAEKVTDVSGRGVGMDVVRSNIQGLSGSVEVFTEVGRGTRFRISLPLTLAIIPALVTVAGESVYVIPLGAVVETFRCQEADLRSVDGRPVINFRGSVLPLVGLDSLFGGGSGSAPINLESQTFVVVNTGGLKLGLVVDQLIGDQEVVIKPLGAFFGDLKGISGATILGDGRVALIVDVAGLSALINRRRADRRETEVEV